MADANPQRTDTDTRTDAGADPSSDATADQRRRTATEIVIVLALSLGASAVYSVINLIGKLTAGRPLASQQATLNASLSPRPYLDLSYQLAGIVFALAPVALVLFLLADRLAEGARRLGLDLRRPGRDLAAGALLAAAIGLPGLALYFAGRALGVTAEVVPAALAPHWWAVPVLVLQAVKNALLEEVVVVGYLMTRLQRFGWPDWARVAASAALRGSYHLYQGFGPFLGNAVMGLVFGEVFRRRGRVAPLVVAHALLDLVAFVGYQLFADALGLR